MNTQPTVFAQIMGFLPLHEFRKCVRKYRGDYRVRKFSCLDQFFCLAFAQLTYRESLRDIVSCLRTMESRLYHMGFRGRISRNNLANANESRDWRIYADFAQVLIGEARRLYRDEDIGLELENTIYAFDSTTIDLLPVAFPLGTIPEMQGRHQAPHASRPEGIDTNDYPYYRRKNSRCPSPRRSLFRARFLLYPGPRISGLLSTLHPSSASSFFRHSGQVKSPIAPPFVSAGRQKNGSNQRPEDRLDRLQIQG